jgi:hypothetical protein
MVMRSPAISYVPEFAIIGTNSARSSSALAPLISAMSGRFVAATIML